MTSRCEGDGAGTLDDKKVQSSKGCESRTDETMESGTSGTMMAAVNVWPLSNVLYPGRLAAVIAAE